MNSDKIIQAIKENKLTLRSLSIKCGIGYATLHDIVTGKAKNPRINTISKIAVTLDIAIDDLLKDKEAKNEKSSFKNKEEKS